MYIDHHVPLLTSISGLMVKFPLAMRELRVRFPADAFLMLTCIQLKNVKFLTLKIYSRLPESNQRPLDNSFRYNYSLMLYQLS